MKKNTKVLLGGSTVILSILILLIAATPGASGTEIPLQEVLANPEKYEERYVTTEGFLVAESIDWRADEIELRFDIVDSEGNVLSVFHHGVRPDNFSEGVITILEGYIVPGEPFNAERVKTKCPSKYEGEDPNNYDPEFHKELLNDN
ncbi:cytochrome c maturation protein CcmE [Anaerobacillus sp. CMMVII]|uniref:cytochrome c maturation protein CcmE n=1 Tax=Anaerobacillus sp. CMMVII TaxID=2755588 RepID=UPI0021B73D55|nr:cytochrome c maturation protein CcmE [Anaerobacillus sp. CMMVII]MCT8136333.1 cytochrome c maturation protein CcmE [Anaerobacillus sp. CMMVII]